MKILIALVVLLLGVSGMDCALGVPQSEKLTGSFTGTVLQSGTFRGVATTLARPITKTWMLQVFGHTEVRSSHAYYYFDNVNNRYVLADKTAATIYGTILQYPASPTVAWNDVKHHTNFFGDTGGTLSMFNGNVTGTEQDSDTSKESKGRYLMVGNINSVPTIIYGSFLVKF